MMALGRRLEREQVGFVGSILPALFNKDRNISCVLQFTQDPDSFFIKRVDQQISQSR